MPIVAEELEAKLKAVFAENGVDLSKAKSGFLIKAMVAVAEYVRDNAVVEMKPHLGPDDVTHLPGSLK